MAEPKTKLNSSSVDDFLNSIKDDQVRKDAVEHLQARGSGQLAGIS